MEPPPTPQPSASRRSMLRKFSWISGGAAQREPGANHSRTSTQKSTGASSRARALRVLESLESPGTPDAPRPPGVGRSRADCGWRLVLRESSRLRQCAEVVVAVLLLYTGTVFPYHLCFCVFHMTVEYERSPSWAALERLIDTLWWIELVLNFFFTYRDSQGREVDVLARITKRYICTTFPINFIACLPIDTIILHYSPGGRSGSGFVKLVRCARLYRLSRLLQFRRMLHLARLLAYSERCALVKRLLHSRGMSALRFVAGLAWVVHMLACGWYLCAALHERPEHTWVARRFVAAGTALLQKGPLEQWCHSMYFVVTVFTTVGFGDMSAFTPGEMVYACCVMLVGTVVHSIIVGEILSVVMSKDDAKTASARRQALVGAFARHAQIRDPGLLARLADFARSTRERAYYDREDIRGILCSSTMPQALLNELPLHVFSGCIAGNKFLASLSPESLPPRLTLLIAVAVTVCYFDRNEIVYQFRERPAAIFLVEKGVFAHVGMAGPQGGTDDAPRLVKKPPDSDLSGARQQFSPSTSLPAVFFRQAVPGRLLPAARQSVTSIESSCSVRKIVHRHLFPYLLVCSGSYFGDAEVFENSACGSTVRCELPDGSLFALRKKDLFGFVEDFPRVGVAWRNQSRVRERKRLQSLSGLTHAGHDCKYVAAATIQRHVRRHQLGAGRSGRPPAPVACTGPEAAADDTRAKHCHPGGAANASAPGQPPPPQSPPPTTSGGLPSACDKLRQEVQADLALALQTVQSELRSGIRALHHGCPDLR